MAKHFFLGKYYDLPHSIIHPDLLVFNFVPWLKEARELANLQGEPAAIWRLLTTHPGEVFISPLKALDEAFLRGHERIVIEVVVNPS